MFQIRQTLKKVKTDEAIAAVRARRMRTLTRQLRRTKTARMATAETARMVVAAAAAGVEVGNGLPLQGS
jgi:hypothetical protein